MIHTILKKKWRKKEYSVFLTYIILISLFFIRISFGAGEAYSKDNSIGLPFYNFEPFIIYFTFFVFINKYGIDNVKITRLFLIIIPIIILQVLYFLAYHIEPITGETLNYLSRFVRAFFFLSAVLIYAIFFFDADIFYSIFSSLLRLIAWISLCSYLANVFLGSTILLHYQMGSDYYRVQAFFSEPSACSAAFSSLFVISLFEKRFSYVVLSLVIIYLAKSPTTFLTFIITCLVFLLLIKKYRILTVFIGSFCIGTVFLIFISTDLVELGTQLFDSESSTMSSIGRLIMGLDDVKSGGGNGSNSRLQGTQALLDEMEVYNLFLTGYGFNASSEYFISKYGDVKDYSLIYSMLFSYGIFGVIVFYLYILKSIIIVYSKDFKFLLIYIPFIIATGMNSAQGLVMYQVVFLGLFVYLNLSIIKIKNETNNTII
jgi:hypothetical protein